MPKSKRPKPLYQRGQYRLYQRDGRSNLEIVWYDEARGRERAISAGTSCARAGALELDRRYLASTGQRICEGCGRPFDGDASPLLTEAIADYILLSEHKAGYKATRSRLAHAVDYIAQSNPAVTCAQIDPRWIAGYRAWLTSLPIVTPKSGQERQRSIGAVEGCVRQLAAAINATPGQQAQFRADQPREVSKSPTYRASVADMAAMFRFALERSERANLLAYLRAAVATWARPAEIYDIAAGQWTPAARVLDLLPAGQRQTKKYRGRIPIAHQFAPYLDEMGARYMSVSTVRSSWEKMRAAIGLPNIRGEAGDKLIRRSMGTLARLRLGEEHMAQVQMMLGHRRASISDVYALANPANLGLSLACTESIIDEIELLAPGAFNRSYTANRKRLLVVSGGKSV